ncbi:oxygen-independent coproporphyrinogen III oxidase [Aliiroseovarius sp. PTFE2010]|uniref:oxygen-independent coproporphyrinogen III oxidase n=1 Tax=Aliiroseovarius sp. PTFE2010 TaxID=3417190 RepID=UPI003CF592CE
MEAYAQLKALGLFDARVPRYTSYPTAPHFKTGAFSAQTASWIAALKPGEEISLYLHIPFCRRLCWFCACRTQGTSTLSPVAAYLDTLKKEIVHLGTLLPDGVVLGNLHWGGGTPTLLEPDMMADLAAAIFDIAPMAPDGEFSVEIDPNELDDSRLDALAAAGMNRASIGVQDFDPAIQETIGRVQSYDVTKAAVDGLRARGINSLNADILYGLPHQTPEKIATSVQQLLSLNPDRVALFGYAHVPWMARRQSMIPTDALPTPQERLALFDDARALFVSDGYDEIGIDHFARPNDSLAVAQKAGRLRRNFQGYTDDRCDTLIGLGASAISRYRQGYAQNAPATSAYQEAVRSGKLATSKAHVFCHDDALRGRIIEALMCDFEVRFDDLNARFDLSRDAFLEFGQGVAAAFPDMVATDSERIAILDIGKPLTRMIARHFDAYQMNEGSHSIAV